MAENNDLLSQQREILVQINSLYSQIKSSLIDQKVLQEGIASGAAASVDAMLASREDLRNAFSDVASAGLAVPEALSEGSDEAERLADVAAESGAEAEESFTSLADVATGLTKAIQAVGKSYDSTLQSIRDNAAGPLRDAYVQIQNAYGGITLGAMNAADGTIEAGNEMSAALMKVTDAVNLAQYSFVTFGEEGRQATLPLQFALGKTGEIMETFNEMAIKQGLINGLSMAELAMSSAGEESIKQMRMVQLGLGLTADETSTFVQRQISLTGKAGTDMLTEAAMSAKAVAKITGTSAKLIGKSLQEIIADTETYGNVTVDEAARISATLAELGIDYKDLGGMVNKYMSFEGAVKSISELTTVFGVQLDSMEMMRLANEDQEQFLRVMRDQFISTGMSVDDMSLAHKRLIKSSLGLQDIESVERLLDPGRALTSIEELSEATKEMAPEDAASRTTQIMQDLGDEILSFADLTKYQSDEIATFIQEGITAPLQHAKIAAEQTTAAMAGAGLSTGEGQMLQAQGAAKAGLDMVIETVPTAVESVNTLVNAMMSGFEDVIELLENWPGLNHSDSFWDITFRDTAPKSIQHTTDALVNMTGEAMSGLDGTNGAIGAFLDLADKIPSSMGIAQDELQKFANISNEDLSVLMQEEDGVGQRLAQQIGYLQAKGGELTEKGREMLAQQLGLGEDWRDKMDIIMSTQADEAAAAQVMQADQAVAMIDSYREMGMSLEDLGGLEGEWAKSRKEALGLTDNELQGIFEGNMDASQAVATSLDRSNIESQKRRAQEQERERAAALREESEDSRQNRRDQNSRLQTEAVTNNTAEIQTLTEKLDKLAEAIGTRPIVVKLGNRAIADYLVENRVASDGNILAMQPSPTG